MKVEEIGFKRYATHPSTLPSFFPFPANPPLSSTPAHWPAFPAISPKYRRVPSNPRLSILTLSPASNDLPARLELRMKVSDCLLDGRTEGVLVRVARVGRAGVAPACEEEDAAEDGRPVTDRRPDCGSKESSALGDGGGIAGSLIRPVL